MNNDIKPSFKSSSTVGAHDISISASSQIEIKANEVE